MLDCADKSHPRHSSLCPGRPVFAIGFNAVVRRAGLPGYPGLIARAAPPTLSLALRRLLLIDKIEILPKARGRNLAAIAVGLVEKHLAAGAMLAVVKPFPLQHGSAHRAYKGEWSRRMRYDLLEDDVESGKKKLQWLYAKMGYRPLRKTPFMLHVLY